MTAPEENYSTLFERTKLLEWCVEFYHQIPEPSWQETGLASLAGAEVRQIPFNSDEVTFVLD